VSSRENRDGATKGAGSILISVRDSGRKYALIFGLKMLRRVARVAVEMHLTGDGVALEGRRPSYNRSQMFCVATPSPLPSCVRAIDQPWFTADPDNNYMDNNSRYLNSLTHKSHIL